MRSIACLLLFAAACQTTATVDDAPGKDDPDTGASPPADESEGEYRGTIEGLNTYAGAETECSGEATFTVDAAGAIDGYLVCTFTNGFAQEGVWAGTEAEGAIDSDWTVDYGNDYIVDFAGVGTYADGTATVDWDWEDADIGVTFVATATLTRQ